MILCRNCEHASSTKLWMMNCKLHPFEEDKYTESCEPDMNADCRGKDFVDKLDKYRRQKDDDRNQEV